MNERYFFAILDSKSKYLSMATLEVGEDYKDILIFGEEIEFLTLRCFVEDWKISFSSFNNVVRLCFHKRRILEYRLS